MACSRGLMANRKRIIYNEYLQIIAEQGAVGLFVIFFVLVYAFQKLSSSTSYAKMPLAGSFVAILVISFFSYPLRNVTTCLLVVCVVLLIFSLPGRKMGKMWGVRCALCVMFLIGTVFCKGSQAGKWGNAKIAHYQWAMLKPYYEKGQFRAIVKNYTLLYPFLKQHTDFLFEYGQCLSRTGDYENSNAVLQEGLQRSSDPMFLNIIGKNYQALGSDSLAEIMFYKASYRIPYKLYPRYLLLNLYKKQGREAEWRNMAHCILRQKEKVCSEETDYIKSKVRDMLNY